MAQTTQLIRPAPAPKKGALFARRLIPAVFLAALGAGTYVSILPIVHAGHHPVRFAGFSHEYPSDRVGASHQTVPGTTPQVPRANTVTGSHVLTSFAQLRNLLPKGLLQTVRGQGWILNGPVAIGRGAALKVSGPGSLMIGPGAFLESIKGGSVILDHLRITGVGRDGRPMAQPQPGRGFLLTDGGRLVLDHDTITDLGYLSDLAFGVSFRHSHSASAVVDCTITGNYRGVFTSAASGVRIVGNTIQNSIEYGIDPHTNSTGLVIEDNHVVNSGLHGIILAVGVQRSRVIGNVVDGAGDHGIVLFDHSNDNVVQGNRVLNTDDGIVVLDSSENRISNNVVLHVVRFGLRLSGASVGNVVDHSLFSNALVGAYIYGGASGNALLDNSFVDNRENVRVRTDAPRNRVSPVPPRSELA